MSEETQDRQEVNARIACWTSARPSWFAAQGSQCDRQGEPGPGGGHLVHHDPVDADHGR